MQQSTAQIKLDQHANYNRIFRSTYRLIDYQLKQHYNQQQCIYCRRSKKQFLITYLEFPSDKQSIDELNDAIQQRVLQLLTTRFTYIAIALSADLMTTKRWMDFYKNLSQHKELNRFLLIRKIHTIIQVYGLHANVQQIQTLITKFLDAHRYETDVVETEQVTSVFWKERICSSIRYFRRVESILFLKMIFKKWKNWISFAKQNYVLSIDIIDMFYLYNVSKRSSKWSKIEYRNCAVSSHPFSFQ